jgi:hypothetical protein
MPAPRGQISSPSPGRKAGPVFAPLQRCFPNFCTNLLLPFQPKKTVNSALESRASGNAWRENYESYHEANKTQV